MAGYYKPASAVRQKTREKTHRSVKNHWTQKTTGYDDQKLAKRTGSDIKIQAGFCSK